MNGSTEIGVYLHIPFCRARCGYCDFVTFTGKEDRIAAYVDQLCREITFYSSVGPGPKKQRSAPLDQVQRSATTVFLGGGTPSLLESRHVEKVLTVLRRKIGIAAEAEVTLEANPESVTPEKAAGWRVAGVNRISLGLQAYDDALLKVLGRLHDTAQFLAAYHALRRAGFDNLNIDLIYGLPGQTMDAWVFSLEKTTALAPEHLSLYALTVEAHTPFAVEGLRTDNDLQAEMYAQARASLSKAGYVQYEVSNFAKPGRECRHNLIYWRQQPYLGFGVGAVGCVDGLRWENVKTLHEYEAAVANSRFPRLSEEKLDARTRKFERLMLGLRLREGFSWGAEDDHLWQSERERLAAAGRLEQVRPDVWRIPEAYVPLTNQILLSFL